MIVNSNDETNFSHELLTAVASALDAKIHKKLLGSGTRTLIISNDKMEDIMKTVKSLEDFGLLLKGVSETIRK